MQPRFQAQKKTTEVQRKMSMQPRELHTSFARQKTTAEDYRVGLLAARALLDSACAEPNPYRRTHRRTFRFLGFDYMQNSVMIRYEMQYVPLKFKREDL